jgi:hypothetical protein
MGPTGTPTEIPEGQHVLLLGGGLGNAVLSSIAKAMRERGNHIIYLAAYLGPAIEDSDLHGFVKASESRGARRAASHATDNQDTAVEARVRLGWLERVVSGSPCEFIGCSMVAVHLMRPVIGSSAGAITCSFGLVASTADSSVECATPTTVL